MQTQVIFSFNILFQDNLLKLTQKINRNKFICHWNLINNKIKEKKY